VDDRGDDLDVQLGDLAIGEAAERGGLAASPKRYARWLRWRRPVAARAMPAMLANPVLQRARAHAGDAGAPKG
jgi:hypothetical protein